MNRAEKRAFNCAKKVFVKNATYVFFQNEAREEGQWPLEVLPNIHPNLGLE